MKPKKTTKKKATKPEPLKPWEPLSEDEKKALQSAILAHVQRNGGRSVRPEIVSWGWSDFFQKRNSGALSEEYEPSIYEALAALVKQKKLKTHEYPIDPQFPKHTMQVWYLPGVVT